MLMKELPQQIFKQLSTLNPADKTDAELREVILNAGKNVEIWQATEKNFGMVRNSKSTGRVSESGVVQKRSTFKKPGRFENKGPQANRYQMILFITKSKNYTKFQAHESAKDQSISSL
jgi:hypothetical protein